MGTKAEFFKCALQVNPAEYIKYRGQKQKLTSNQYNQRLLKAAIETDIKLIGLANHGSIDGFEKIKKLFNRNGITVLPGFEISSSEKCHFVCLFDEDKTEKELNQILGYLGLSDNPTDPSRFSAIELIDKVNQKGGFIYAAHCTSDSGILKLKLNHVWQYEGLSAAQIPYRSLSKIKDIKCSLERLVLQNLNADYKRQQAMTLINAKDVANPEDIMDETASCLIRMAKPCFASFKQAFVDPQSRIRLNSDLRKNNFSALERIEFLGGYIEGVDAQLSEHLNAIIGARGTGKSTFLECIRYAFDLKPMTANSINNYEKILNKNLVPDCSVITVTLRSHVFNGRRFKVMRVYGNPPTVFDEHDNITPHTPLDLLPNLMVYGQNEIYEIACDPHACNRLIYRHLENEKADFDESLDELMTLLSNNRNQLNHYLDIRNELEAEVKALPKLLDRAKLYESMDLDETLELISKRRVESYLTSMIDADIKHIEQVLNMLQFRLGDVYTFNDLSSTLRAKANSKELNHQRQILTSLVASIDRSHTDVRNYIKKAKTDLNPFLEKYKEQRRKEQLKIDEAFESKPFSVEGKTKQQIKLECQSLFERIEQLRINQVLLKDLKSKIDELKENREELLWIMQPTIDRRAKTINKLLKKLSRKLGGKVRISLAPRGDRQAIVDFLVEAAPEVLDPEDLDSIKEDDLAPNLLAWYIKRRKRRTAQELGIMASDFKKLKKIPESKLMELEELKVPDLFQIELNINQGNESPRYKPIDELSMGQKCTAILHLLLISDSDPLIIDQPEDDLGNAFIAKEIVPDLRQMKLNRQFLFATHNVNIPVLGDAEWIGVLNNRNGKRSMSLDQQGAIDLPEIQELVVDVLEGGNTAFNQRLKKYGYG